MTETQDRSTRTGSSAGATIEIELNGSRTSVAAALTIERLIAGVAPGGPRGMAVAVNDAVVPRSRWASRRLEPGDVVEIVRATQGG